MPTGPIRQVIHGRKLVSLPPAMAAREALGAEITQFEADLQQRDEWSEKM